MRLLCSLCGAKPSVLICLLVHLVSFLDSDVVLKIIMIGDSGRTFIIFKRQELGTRLVSAFLKMFFFFLDNLLPLEIYN